ncbi:MAG: 2-C-methyl-D-erythritol 2,4-cyclodiphosphate synthase [Chitinophagales bacterium]|nr:2-C-methyl-D-erythritol 2,4-cyclodiphosphate synthase [Chitinophagales bacterium]
MSYRIGQGIDFHQLEEGREFWLGGILIPHDKGAVGHSDADVLLHAICDAMLGALALGDIGVHFPDTDPQYKGADSKKLLAHCYKLISEKGYSLVNVDSTLLLQAPKIKPHIPQMQQTIADILSLSIDDVSIKATTTEHLSFIGREEGVVATVNILLKKN